MKANVDVFIFTSHHQFISGKHPAAMQKGSNIKHLDVSLLIIALLGFSFTWLVGCTNEHEEYLVNAKIDHSRTISREKTMIL